MTHDLQRCYDILDLNPSASYHELKHARRELAKVWHPDRFTNDVNLQLRAEEKLKEINSAYETIEKHLSRINNSRVKQPIHQDKHTNNEQSDINKDDPRNGSRDDSQPLNTSPPPRGQQTTTPKTLGAIPYFFVALCLAGC